MIEEGRPEVGAGSVRHVQLYDVSRTAHFERIIRSGASTTILYSQRRYDFDEDLALRVGARRVGVLGAFWYALLHEIDVLEIAEPLLVRAAPRSFAAISGARIRSAITRNHPAIVTYAIENKDPEEALAGMPLRTRLKYRVRYLFVRRVWSLLDRVAFGTSQAQHLYGRLLGPNHATFRLIPALPTAEPVTQPSTVREPILTFLGEFSERKGFPVLLDAWHRVRQAVPNARLMLVGKGAGADAAQELSDRDPTVTVVTDPPRGQIFAILSATKVLALPSQPRRRWREQVGLPIVEALGQGCLIVTTAETGLAGWLADHGHGVVADPADTRALAHELIGALRSSRAPGEVLADLPAHDGRAEAERWILEAVGAA